MIFLGGRPDLHRRSCTDYASLACGSSGRLLPWPPIQRQGASRDMVGSGTDKTKQLLTGGPAIVLVRPQLAVNIGMAARAMANFGLSDLRLVAPRGDLTRDDARAAAAGALHVFETAKLYP